VRTGWDGKGWDRGRFPLGLLWSEKMFLPSARLGPLVVKMSGLAALSSLSFCFFFTILLVVCFFNSAFSILA